MPPAHDMSLSETSTVADMTGLSPENGDCVSPTRWHVPTSLHGARTRDYDHNHHRRHHCRKTRIIHTTDFIRLREKHRQYVKLVHVQPTDVLVQGFPFQKQS